MTERLLIVGASVRAAAVSARRAGFEPLAIDRFADADLRGVCRDFQRFDELQQVPRLAKQMPSADWMYTGPLENCWDLVAQLGRQRCLCGNDAATLRQARDPAILAAAFHGAGLPAPELSDAAAIPDGDGWLKKPLRAAGGFGIERVDFTRQSDPGHRSSTYLQQFIPGRSMGATFIGVRGRGRLVGVAEQLLGPSWGASREFQYVGSIGPTLLSPSQLQALRRIGDCVAASFPIQGLFGVDAIFNDKGVWPVELNPRYTASVEILERALDIKAMIWHIAACRSRVLPDLAHMHSAQDRIDQHGKAIVYATRDFVVDEHLSQELLAMNGAGSDPIVADIPVAGTSIKRGEPIVTVFAKGRMAAEVKEELQFAITAMKRFVGDA